MGADALDVEALGVEALGAGGAGASANVAAIWAWMAEDSPESVAPCRELAGFGADGSLTGPGARAAASGDEAAGAIGLAGAAAAKAVAAAAGCSATGCPLAELGRRAGAAPAVDGAGEEAAVWTATDDADAAADAGGPDAARS